MAQDGLFDLYYVFVELIAGNLITAMFFVVLALFLIGIVTRTNLLTTLFINFLFITTYLGYYFGGLYLALNFILAGGWIGYSLFQWWKGL